MTFGKLRAKLVTPLSLCLAFGFLSFLLFHLLRQEGLMQPIELAIYDGMLRLQSYSAADPRIVIIGETEEDLQRLGHPLPDSVMADILQRLLEAGASVIGVDKYRDIPTPLLEGCTTAWEDLMAERCMSKGRRELDNLLRENPNIVWIRLFGGEDSIAVRAPPVLYTFEGGTSQIGINDNVVDNDGVLRRGLLYLDIPPACMEPGMALEECPEESFDPGDFGYALGLMLAMVHTGVVVEFNDAGEAVLGPTVVAPLEADDGGYRGIDNAGFQFMLDFPGRPHAFKTYTIGDLIDGRIPPGALVGKVVLIGAMTPSLRDEIELPFATAKGADAYYYGVLSHGYITAQLLDFINGTSEPRSFVSDTRETLFLLAWSLLGGMLGRWVRSLQGFMVMVGLGLLVISGMGYLAFLGSVWAPFGAPMLAWTYAAVVSTAYMSGREQQERQQLMGMFSQHVSKDVAEALWKERDQYMEGGRPRPRRQTATVLFTDIVGFTGISETMEPDELMEWLNDFIERIVDSVLANGGIINKFIGDAVMGVFGAPKARESDEEVKQDAVNAVKCALEMVKILDQVNTRNRKSGLPHISIRVGIFTGPVLAGSLGSSERMEYTVIGDTVNTASRLESLKGSSGVAPAFEHDCRILIGETTYRMVSDQYQAREAGSIVVKGKSQPLQLYQVILPE